MAGIWMDVDTALSEVPVNILALVDDTDFKTREESVTYDQAGMDLVWNFVTTAGAYTQTAVTPTTGGDYDWTNQGNGMYSIEIPASGGASINNDTEGFGWFTGFATGILPWASPIIGFRAAALNNALIDGGDNLDVNTVQWLGQAVTLSTGNKPDVNIDEISDDATAASNLEAALENGTAGYVASDMKYLDGGAQSATDLKDFADAGYDPSTNKVQGVVLTDTCTANSDLVTANNVRDAILDDATRFSGANIDAAITSRSVAGDDMNLADDAITSAKYDESTAFPIGSADTGTTEIARTGADSDTLETLSDQIDGTSTHTAAAVWAVGSRTLTSFGTLVADTTTAVWAALTSGLTTVGSIGKKLADWVLGSDDKVLLSNNAQTGVTIPTVTDVSNRVTANSDQIEGVDATDQIRDAVLDDATRFSGANIDATISSRSSHTAANVWAVGSRTLTSFGTLVADTATAVWAYVTRTLTSGGDATEAKQDIIIADIAAQNDVSTAQVQSSCDTAITSNSTIVAINAKTANLPSGIKKNVALDDFIFEMVLASDHITPATGLTVTCQIIKDGAAYVDSTNSVTEISAGSYKISFTQAEMNYGILAWKFTAPTADQKVVVVITSA